MKKSLFTFLIFGSFILSGFFTNQGLAGFSDTSVPGPNDLWKVVSNVLQPVKTTWTLLLPGTTFAGNVVLGAANQLKWSTDLGLKRLSAGIVQITNGTTGLGGLRALTVGLLEGGSSPSFYSIFQGGNQAGNITYTLPTAQSSGTKFLQNDGSGVLSWESSVTPTGTPASGQVALLSGATSITGDSGFKWAGTGESFTAALHGKLALPSYGLSGIWEPSTDLGQANGVTSAYFSFEPTAPQTSVIPGSYITGGDFSFWARQGYSPSVAPVYQGLTATAAWDSTTTSSNKVDRLTALESAAGTVTGTINFGEVSGLFLRVVHFGTGLIDNAYGVKINAVTTGGVSSAITNSYGLYIGEQATAGITNAWQLYSSGTAPSYFAGDLQARTGNFDTSVITPLVQVTLDTPTTSSDTCTAGQMWADDSFIYVCTATNTIKRVVLLPF